MIFLCTSVGILVLDQLSKYYIRSNFTVGESLPVINEWVKLLYTENAGAAFGILEGGRWVFVLTSSVFIVLAALLYPRVQAFGWPIMVSLGFVVGGTVGNLIDRVFRGTVTDFVSVKYFPAAFNVADAAIVVGCLVLIICIVFYPHRMEIPGARQ